MNNKRDIKNTQNCLVFINVENFISLERRHYDVMRLFRCGVGPI